jgi:ATP-binding cassette subfamily F protein 3
MDPRLSGASPSPSVWASGTPPSGAPPRSAPPLPPSSAGERREAEKQKQALLRRLRRREGEILKTLEELEAEKARLEAELAKPEVYRNGERVKNTRRRLEEVKGALEEKSREWEATAEELAAAGGL